MSYTRIFTCLEQTACKITRRGSEVLKYGAICGFVGAAGGAVSGGLAVAGVSGSASWDAYGDYIDAHTPASCSIINHTNHDIKCTDPNMAKSIYQAAHSYASTKASEEVADKAALIMLASTLSGFALGFFSGVCYGWNKTLPVEELDHYVSLTTLSSV